MSTSGNDIAPKVGLPSTVKKSDDGSVEYEHDVTGCPLDFVFDMTLHENSPRNSHEILKNHKSKCLECPVSASEARYLFELYNMPIHDESTREIPLFAFCDGKDPEHTVLMGLLKNKRILVTNKGPYAKKDDFPKFASCKRYHLKYFPRSFSSIETSFYASYDALSLRFSNEVNSLIKPGKTGLLAIECTWESICAVLQKPPADATCTVLIQAAPGDDRDGAVAKFKELKLLKALHNCLLTGQMVWPNENADKAVLEKIVHFMNELKSISSSRMQQEDLIAETTDFNSAFPSAVIENRKNIDFTDQLWIILSGCSSYHGLSNALMLVFNELSTFTFPPFVYNKNMTTIGKIVRNLNKHPVVCPKLESSVAIRLLLEIGVEKMQKDYTMLFVGFELASYETFLPYLHQDRLSEKAVRTLEKLHTILELILICWAYLNLPKIELCSITRTALKHYTSEASVDPKYIFKFPVSPFSVKAVLEKLEATFWQTSLKSSCDGFKKQTVLQINKKPLCHRVSKEKVFGSPPPVQIPQYYCTTTQVIEDSPTMSSVFSENISKHS